MSTEQSSKSLDVCRVKLAHVEETEGSGVHCSIHILCVFEVTHIKGTFDEEDELEGAGISDIALDDITHIRHELKVLYSH